MAPDVLISPAGGSEALLDQVDERPASISQRTLAQPDAADGADQEQQQHIEAGELPACIRRPLAARLWEITAAYTPLMYTTFGGPQAHIALLIVEFVEKRAWLPSNVFAELFAIAQSLPGPSSTQLAYSLALVRGGVLAGLWAFVLWSFPCMLIMIGFGIGVSHLGSSLPPWVIYLQNGLTASAVGLVALAAFKLSTKLLADPISAFLGAFSAILAINLYTEPWLFPALMIFGGLVSWAEAAIISWHRRSVHSRSPGLIVQIDEPDEVTIPENPDAVAPKPNQASSSASSSSITATVSHEDENATDFRVGFNYSTTTGIMLLATWILFLIVAVVLRTMANDIRPLSLIGTMYFVGSIIFGGGPVVIPLLQNYVVTNGWLTDSEFLIGIAIINALPGPNFNIAAYVGVLTLRNAGIGASIAGAILANIGIFSPGLLLMSGLLPLWNRYRTMKAVQTIFKGVNAAAVGLVFAAIYLLAKKAFAPINGGGVAPVEPLESHPVYFGIAVFSYTASGFLKLPTPFAILIGGLIGTADCLIMGHF